MYIYVFANVFCLLFVDCCCTCSWKHSDWYRRTDTNCSGLWSFKAFSCFIVSSQRKNKQGSIDYSFSLSRLLFRLRLYNIDLNLNFEIFSFYPGGQNGAREQHGVFSNFILENSCMKT